MISCKKESQGLQYQPIKKDVAVLINKTIDSVATPSIKIPASDNKSTSNKHWKGEYEITTKAISNYNNTEIDLLYSISLSSDASAIVSIGADQVQDYWCEGEYYLTDENGILHATGKCDEDDINDFYLKYQNGIYFIKSKRFLIQDWQVLKKE